MRLLQPGSVGHTSYEECTANHIHNHEEYDVHGNDFFFQTATTVLYDVNFLRRMASFTEGTEYSDCYSTSYCKVREITTQVLRKKHLQ